MIRLNLAHKLRMLRHNLFAHPLAGILWAFNLERAGDWVHETF